MTDTPRFTVLLPCLNACDLVERAVCSVLDQGRDDVELIVIDGGSDDGTDSIVDLYTNEPTQRVVLVEQDEFQPGPCGAVNQGISEARSEIILVLHARSVLLPGALDALDAAFEDSSTSWVLGHTQRLGPTGEPRGVQEAASPEDLAEFLMHDAGPLPLAGAAFRRGTLIDQQGVDATFLHAGGDELAARLLACGIGPVILDEVLVGRHESHRPTAPETLIEAGLELVRVGERYAEATPITRRYAVRKNLDERRRVYAIAQAETRAWAHRRFLWAKLLQRPWWLASESYRHALIHGVHRALVEADRADAA